MITKAIAIELALVVLALCVAQLSVLPAYTLVHGAILGVICLASGVAGWFFLFALSRYARAARGSSGIRQALRWVLLLAAALAHICWIPIALFLCICAAHPHDGMMGSDEFVGTTSSGGETFHLYHVNCAIPDSACECDDYHSLVYREDRYLPLLHRVASPAFFVDLKGIVLRDGVLTLTAELCRPEDAGKTLRIPQ